MSTGALPAFTRGTINLAAASLGARGIFATDEFFGPLSRMLADEPAVFHPGLYDENGKWMDGWETRRRRGPGHDHAVIALATPGRIRGFDVDTAFFTGNFPTACAIEACHAPEGPDDRTAWVELLGPSPLGPSAQHFFDCAADGLYSHVRLRIYPDGGVARLRVYGIPTLAPAEGPIDLAAALAGGQVIALSNGHYGHQRLLAPGRGVNMGDGWETSRRREPGHEWIVVKLATRATVESIVVDTAHFKGNYPDACSMQAADLTGSTGDLPTLVKAASMFWQEILPEQKLAADRIHTFDGHIVKRAGAVTHVRLNIHPDGGVSRLRVFGHPAEGGKT
ncbi:allantoicase [Shinella sp. CPCC 100929]|uniref:Probable allantoicase n=1 Tax=Shinella lacus TaxID=2654216 RepID=A0ABT1RI17_9HYPH|nr:allantoicase [Shinella lacus]MCQ4634823.1 allantoicase [Shinella lacus]